MTDTAQLYQANITVFNLIQEHEMEIPTELALTVNGALQDPLSKSVVYTFTLNQTDKYTLVHSNNTYDEDQLSVLFPYSKDTFWIQIRTAYFT